MEAPLESEPVELEPGYYAPWWAHEAVYLLYLGFMIWMLVDSIRRYGLSYWAFVIFFFQPLGALVYFVLHVKSLFRGGLAAGGGKGLFGLGLKARIRKAEQALRMADTPAAREELAGLYYEAGRLQDCERLLAPLVEQEDGNYEARYHLGLCRLAAGDPQGALVHLEKVMAGEKKLRFGRAWLRYAECLHRLGRTGEAVEELRKLHRAYPRPLTEFAYAKALAESGAREQARQVLEEMLETSGQAPAEDRRYLSEGKALLRSLA
ncbi:MAG: tetratricopeptide repeat protein [Planctomycetota bacterium]|nr:tetratricopeptide repeat protein [Planctomycetota bacterium]